MRKGDETRTKILNVAENLFKSNGYENTTTRDIAESANLNHGNLYYYYKRKDDILIDILRIRLNNLFVFIKGKLMSENILLLYPVYLRIIVDLFVINPERVDLFVKSMTSNYLRNRLIDLYYEIYDKNLNLNGFNKYIVYESTIASVGLQSTLLVKFLNNELETSKNDICSTIIRKTFSGIISEEMIKYYTKESILSKNEFFEKYILEYLKEVSFKNIEFYN